MAITFPSDTKDKIDDIRDAIGRTITFNSYAGQTGCTASGCSLDPVTGVSTNSFCPTCGGNYWTDVISGHEITAHVRWNSMDKGVGYSAGEVFEGECRAQIEYTAANVNIVNTSETVQVDGKLMSIDRRTYKGVPELNRIVLILNEEEKDV